MDGSVEITILASDEARLAKEFEVADLSIATRSSSSGFDGQAVVSFVLALSPALTIIVVAWLRSRRFLKVKVGKHEYTGYSANDVARIEAAINAPPKDG